MHVIDGKKLADDIIAEVALDVKQLVELGKAAPGLAVVLVGEDPASAIYVRNKIKRAQQAGMKSIEKRLPVDCSQSELEAVVEELNQRHDVHGILVQLPLPKHLSEERIIRLIAPHKDVDGFHPENVGLLATGQASLIPCTPLGCLEMLKRELGDLSGKHAVIVGRSNIVGKPMANLLLQANCTITVVHSRTSNASSLARQADILVAAVGVPELIDETWVKPGAVVIDVGINAIERDSKRKLVGDVNYEKVAPYTRAITPVPGGVGPMTIACLMKNTLVAAQHTAH
ncbi:bifunctional methylenetetrahydrofolate dehydrogenase/methenyltetrahydrofolate cyclohydrolase FolD [Marinomonas piezotolerans]|uniref:Bifunctional protein FolD n=1 Tax=Marinomonas piezotolerans TaxID=2213058 RepID=A0A370U9R4_9GAMM|nr:bifunctional methylenetetrahydrofolate dehydrogenase/methenyltetrahydrofolate cyclohydrolase FolD [Marinomonas piezotolerans]RDL44511.1 bifunctional methylenetetrahydrofolate dehydrogenase/methenyltetrahydrofolate cyclohydrolase FolD [Marinomonas piezotolerans]